MNKKVIFALTMAFVLSALAVTPLFAQDTLKVKPVEPSESMKRGYVHPASVRYNQGGRSEQPAEEDTPKFIEPVNGPVYGPVYGGDILGTSLAQKPPLDTTQPPYASIIEKINKYRQNHKYERGTASSVPEASNIGLGRIPSASLIKTTKLFINAINKKDDKAFNEVYMSSAPSLALKAKTKNVRAFRKEALENTFECLEPVETQEEKTALALSIDPGNVDAFMSLYEDIYKNQSGEERTQLIQNTFAQFKVTEDCKDMLSEE